MVEQQQLFVGAVEDVVLQVHFIPGDGWTTRLTVRRQFEQWAQTRSSSYTRLSTDELGDVLDLELGSVLAALGLTSAIGSDGAG